MINSKDVHLMQIGKKIIHLSSIDSTNNYIANRISEDDMRHGTVILADEQYAGKGQRGNKWLTKAGENLTFSFCLLNVNLSVKDQFNLTKIVALSIIHFLQRFGIEAKIKWPNDIYVNDTKIAGILIENSIAGSSLKNSIVGIGLNVNQLEFEGIAATSMQNETKAFYNLKELIFSYIQEINKFNLDIDYNAEFHQYLYLKDKKALFRSNKVQFQGTIQHVDENGNLIIDVNGLNKAYSLKEIEFISKQI